MLRTEEQRRRQRSINTGEENSTAVHDRERNQKPSDEPNVYQFRYAWLRKRWWRFATRNISKMTMVMKEQSRGKRSMVAIGAFGSRTTMWQEKNNPCSGARGAEIHGSVASAELWCTNHESKNLVKNHDGGRPWLTHPWHRRAGKDALGEPWSELYGVSVREIPIGSR